MTRKRNQDETLEDLVPYVHTNRENRLLNAAFNHPGMTLQEIADQVGVSRESIKTVLRDIRARRREDQQDRIPESDKVNPMVHPEQESYEFDEELLEFAQTDLQKMIMGCLMNRGPLTVKTLSDITQQSESDVHNAMDLLKSAAAIRGYSPEHDMTHKTPSTHMVHGTSTFYKGDDYNQWVKTNVSAEQQMVMYREAIQALRQDIPQVSPTLMKDPAGDEDLLNLFVVTDYHFGMMAMGEETGDEDWDMDKSEQLLLRWFQHAIETAPKARRAILGNIGDFAHTDFMEAMTPTHGHLLDAAGRFPEIVRRMIRLLSQVTNMLLQKYEQVHVIHATGNHDINSSVWLKELFAFYYDNEPRVYVETSPDPYYAVEHGKVSLFFHHGHKRNPGNVDQVMVGKFRDLFGRTEFSYCHMGHRHHKDAKERTLMEVEQHRTLSPKDSHASIGGYLSQRASSVITYHKDYGEVSRVTVTPKMLLDSKERT